MKNLITLTLLMTSVSAFSSGLPKEIKWKCEKLIVGAFNELSIKLKDECLSPAIMS
jgi:hypothetical protein